MDLARDKVFSSNLVKATSLVKPKALPHTSLKGPNNVLQKAVLHYNCPEVVVKVLEKHM